MPNMPKNVVVVLLDSLNRHMLGSYGGTEFDTPNLDRFARRVGAVRQPLHRFAAVHAGAPRPAVGALDFPWKPWGSIELWEEPITQPLRRAGVTTMLVTDHPHLFENGGENYHTDFRGMGLPARARRRSVAHARRSVAGSAHRRSRPRTAAVRAVRPEPHVVPTTSRLSGTADDVDGRRLARRERTRARTTASCCSSTSSIRTSRSTHPTPWANRYDPTWEGAADSSGRRTRRRGSEA